MPQPGLHWLHLHPPKEPLQLRHQGTSWAEGLCLCKPNRRISASSIRDKHMFTGCPAPGAYGCAPQSHLCDSASSGIWLQPRMNRRDIPPAPGHGLKLQQLPRVTQYSCGDFTSCACSRPSHRPGSCVDMLGAATALFQTKPKAPSKQRNKAGLAKPESDQITSSCSSAGWALASVAGGKIELFE